MKRVKPSARLLQEFNIVIRNDVVQGLKKLNTKKK